MKVFQVDEGTWMAGEDGASCLEEYLTQDPDAIETVKEFGAPLEMSDDDMDTLQIEDPDTVLGPMSFRSFLEYLEEENRIQDKPFLFCQYV